MKRGRPKKPAGERKAVVLCLRITKKESRELADAAKKAGLSVREYAKKKLVGG